MNRYFSPLWLIAFCGMLFISTSWSEEANDPGATARRLEQIAKRYAGSQDLRAEVALRLWAQELTHLSARYGAQTFEDSLLDAYAIYALVATPTEPPLSPPAYAALPDLLELTLIGDPEGKTSPRPYLLLAVKNISGAPFPLDGLAFEIQAAENTPKIPCACSLLDISPAPDGGAIDAIPPGTVAYFQATPETGCLPLLARFVTHRRAVAIDFFATRNAGLIAKRAALLGDKYNRPATEKTGSVEKSLPVAKEKSPASEAKTAAKSGVAQPAPDPLVTIGYKRVGRIQVLCTDKIFKIAYDQPEGLTEDTTLEVYDLPAQGKPLLVARVCAKKKTALATLLDSHGQVLVGQGVYLPPAK